MATWTTIPDANLDPDSPARSVDALALRDNPVAIAEGASGAPKIQAGALDTSTAERDWVLARTASATAGAVGTYVLAASITTTADYVFGANAPGSNLSPSGIYYNQTSNSVNSVDPSGSLSGTWRCMGRAQYNEAIPDRSVTLWLRIS